MRFDDYTISRFGNLKSLQDFTFDKYTVTEENRGAVEIARAFNPKAESLYISGSAGSGKTHLAYAICNDAYKKDKSFIALKPMELIRRFRMKEVWEEEEQLKLLSDVHLLLIDDLGVEKSTEFAVTTLYEIIDKRIMNYRNGLIITSNFTLDEFAAKIAAHKISSRIFGLCKIIELSGKDWRVQK